MEGRARGIPRTGGAALRALLALVLALGLAPVVPTTAWADEQENQSAPLDASSETVEVDDWAGLVDALESSGQIKLRDNIEPASSPSEVSVSVPSGVSTTLNLNGCNVTGHFKITVEGDLTVIDSRATTGPVVSDDGQYTVSYKSGKIESSTTVTAVVVKNGGKFTLNSGTVVCTKGNGAYAGVNDESSGSVTVNGGYIKAREYGIGAAVNSSVIVNGGVVESLDNGVLAGNGTEGYGGYNIELNGGFLIGGITKASFENGYVSCGIYHPNNGTVSVTGGTIVSKNGAGILARSGSTNVTDGKIIALGNKDHVGKVGDSKVTVGVYGIVLDVDAGYPNSESSSVTISGNPTVRGSAGAVGAVDRANQGVGRISITGGLRAERSKGKFRKISLRKV